MAMAIEYEHQWVTVLTPRGRIIPKLRASGRRTSDKGCSGWLDGWASPTASKTTPQSRDNRCLARDAILYFGSEEEAVKLEMAGWVPTGWPTPMAGTPAQNGNNAAGNNDSSRKTVLLAGWTTPQAHDVSPRGKGQKAKHGTKHGCADLNADAAALGPTPEQSSAGTGKPGEYAQEKMLLNPFCSLWLMGFPVQWGLVMTSALMQRKKG